MSWKCSVVTMSLAHWPRCLFWPNPNWLYCHYWEHICLMILCVKLSPLYLCTTVCLLITLFQFPGECFFWLICRCITILLALCGNPWIWIACPLENTFPEDIFFLFSIGNERLKISRSLKARIFCPFSPYCLTQLSPSAKCVQAWEEAEDFFPPTIPHLPPFATSV